MPDGLKAWLNSRFNKDEAIIENGAAFDLVRASVNLVLAGLLIVLGTSLKLPLSTTYVAFMVAMGTSLADRAWGRESAVFRVTGVMSVIGGWFITAGAAFIICFFVTLVMYYGGVVAMVVMIGIAVLLLVKSNSRYRRKMESEKTDDIIRQLTVSKDEAEVWLLLRRHVQENLVKVLDFAENTYLKMTEGFIREDLRSLRRAVSMTNDEKDALKKIRRKEMLGMRRINRNIAIEKNTWFHLGSNSSEQMMYCLKRMCEPCKEHVDNNFNPMTPDAVEEFLPVRNELVSLLHRARVIINSGNYDDAELVLVEAEEFKNRLSSLNKLQMERLQEEDASIKLSLVYLNLLQESQELVSIMRHMLRASRKFQC